MAGDKSRPPLPELVREASQSIGTGLSFQGKRASCVRSRERVFQEKGGSIMCKGPGEGKIAACILSPQSKEYFRRVP